MQKKLILILWLAIVVSFLVFSLKYTAYYLTNSTALYADAIESLVNIFTSIMSLYAIYISFKPADSNHIYGHYKVEYLFAIVEGILILGIAILIFYHSYNNIISYANGKKLILHNISWGLIFNFIALVVNLILTKCLFAYSRKYKSPVLAAEGHHLLSDIMLSCGIIIGIIFTWWTGWILLDSIISLLIAIFISIQGIYVIWNSVNGLMDYAVSSEESANIKEIIEENYSGAIEYHDLKTRVAGRVTFIEFHLVVSRYMQVGEAHEICDRIEDALTKEGYQVTIHIEPDTHAHNKY